MTLKGPAIISGRRPLMQAVLLGLSEQPEPVILMGGGVSSLVLESLGGGVLPLSGEGVSSLVLTSAGGAQLAQLGGGVSTLALLSAGGAALGYSGSGESSLVLSSVGGGTLPNDFPQSAFSAAGGFMVLDAEDPQGEQAIIQSFGPSDVDTVANKISLPHRGFGAYTTVSSAKGTRGWFGTTGTLMGVSGAALTPGTETQPGTIVYRVDDGTGKATFYRAATDADYAVIPGAVQGEYIPIAQRYAEAADPLDFTDGGSGTHTFYTYPLTNTLTTKYGGYTISASSSGDPNTWFEIVTRNGRRYIFNDTSSADPSQGNYRLFGKRYAWNDTALSQAIANKRFIWQIATVNLPYAADRSVPRTRIVGGANVDVGTDTINQAHPFATGDAIKLKVKPGSSLPGGTNDTDTFGARRISDTSFTIHSTPADAVNNTGLVNLTSTGGDFIIYALARAGDDRQIRMRFISELGDPTGGVQNALTARSMAETSVYAASAVSVSGGTNGQITGSPLLVDGEGLFFWLPPGSTGPTRQDTGLPLVPGRYPATLTPGGGSFRIHDTLQSQVESIGQTTASAACTNIKFSAQGTGQFSMFFTDTFNGRLSTIGDSEVQASKRIPCDVDVVWSSGVDMNKPGETFFRVYHGVNLLVAEDDLVTNIAVGDTGNYSPGVKPGSAFNSGASHVSINGYVSCVCWFTGTGAPDTANMQAVMDWQATRSAVRVLPVNTVAPSIATPSAGTQITAQIGSWTGPGPWTWSFQWQRADDQIGTNAVNIAGATSIRYTPSAPDIGKCLSVVVTVANRSGSTTARSAWSVAVPNNAGQAEMLAFVARLSADPVPGFKTALQDFYAALINAGLLARHDRIACHMIYGVPTAGGGSLTVADALLNLVGNNTGSVTGNLVWTAKSGAESVDTTGYIDSGLDPTPGTMQYQRNSASLWELLATAPAGNASNNIGGAGARAAMNPRISSGAATVILNATSGTYTSAVQANWDGFWCGLRRNSTNIDFIHDATTLVAGAAQTSQALAAGNMRDFRSSGASSKTGRIAATGFGAAMTISEAQTLRTALLNFQAAVAAL